MKIGAAKREVDKIARNKNVRVFQAYLAEEYDGLSQFTWVRLSRGASSTAVRARVAAGDGGTGATFPIDTMVTVASVRGHVEVLSLGEAREMRSLLPTSSLAGHENEVDSFVIDHFNNRIVADGWGTASSGYSWQRSLSGGGGLNISVQDDVGYHNGGNAGSSANAVAFIQNSIVDTWFGDDTFSIYFEIEFSQGPGITVGQFLRLVFGYSDTSNLWWRSTTPSIGWWHGVVLDWSATAAETRIGVTTDIGDQDTIPSAISWSTALTLAQDIPYGIRWERNGSAVKARIWELSVVEPTIWDIEATVTADFTDPLDNLLYMFQRGGFPPVIPPLLSTNIITLIENL